MAYDLLRHMRARGLALPLDGVPQEFCETESCITMDTPLGSQDAKLFDGLSNSLDPDDNSAAYSLIRTRYVNQLRADVATQEIRRKFREFRRVLTDGEPSEIDELLQKRHNWRTRAFEHAKADQTICKSSRCINLATPGSEYCLNHILLDPHQTLFAECTVCHRPYPIVGVCTCSA
jgi:hypothetical protein